jgi:hypothetical protein
MNAPMGSIRETGGVKAGFWRDTNHDGIMGRAYFEPIKPARRQTPRDIMKRKILRSTNGFPLYQLFEIKE